MFDFVNIDEMNLVFIYKFLFFTWTNSNISIKVKHLDNLNFSEYITQHKTIL